MCKRCQPIQYTRLVVMICITLAATSMWINAACSAVIDQGLVICLKRGTGYTNSDLEGTYGLHALQVQGLEDPNGVPQNYIESRVFWADLTYTSATDSVQIAWNDFQSDTQLGRNGSGSASYSVNSDGTWESDFDPNVKLASGGQRHISANRQYLMSAGGDHWAANGQVMLGLGLGIRRPATGSITANVMDGTYHFYALQLTDTSEMDPRAAVVWGTQVVDGTQWTLTQSYVLSDGRLFENEPDSRINDLQSDGRFTTDEPGENEIYRGQLSADTRAYVMSKGVVDSIGNIDTTLAVGIRSPEGGAYDNADLNGEYAINVLSITNMEDVTGQHRRGGVTWGTFAFDAAGGLSMSGSTFDSGATESGMTGKGTYTVDAGGAVTFIMNIIPQDDNGRVNRVVGSGHLSDDGELMAMVYYAMDGDDDGLPDNAEYGPDGDDPSYDGNNDGVADSEQSGVASCPTADGNHYATLAVAGTHSLAHIAMRTNPSPLDSPAGRSFDWGFFDFTITGVTPGDTADIRIYLPAGSVPEHYHKYGPTTANTTPHWYNFDYNAATGLGAEYNASLITLHLRDGGAGDDDLNANGQITDVGAPAAASTTPSVSPPGSGGGGGGGGCYIRWLQNEARR